MTETTKAEVKTKADLERLVGERGYKLVQRRSHPGYKMRVWDNAFFAIPTDLFHSDRDWDAETDGILLGTAAVGIKPDWPAMAEILRSR